MDAMNQTIIETPKPSACSTVERKSLVKNLLKKVPATFQPDKSDVSDPSLLLSKENVKASENKFAATSNMTSANFAALYRQQQLEMAEKTVKRYSMRNSTIPASPAESTVNESDLLKSRAAEKTRNFSPTNISTPRTSNVSEVLSKSAASGLLDFSSVSKDSFPHFAYLDELAEKLKNPNISITDICKEFDRFDPSRKGDETGSEIFTPGEQCEGKFLADELSWKRERDIPIMASDSLSSSVLTEPMAESMGEFFKQKSENLANLGMNQSPEKRPQPTPLIDTSELQMLPEKDVQISTNLSVASASQIGRLLDNMNLSDSPGKFVEGLLKKKKCKDENQVQRNQNQAPSKSVFKEPLKAQNANELMPRQSEIFETESLRGSSVRSASTMNTLPHGRLPLQTSRSELIWGCIKLGKNCIRNFKLRNQSEKRLKLQIETTGDNFRILRDRQEYEPSSMVPVMLYPNECRMFYVMYSPTKIGASVGKLNFYPFSDRTAKKQSILLNGYGGHSCVEFQNVAKDTAGKLWLSLGLLESEATTSKNFIIQNNGTLPTFVALNTDSRGLFSFANVSVSPRDFILQPQEFTKVTVTYTPTKGDFRHVLNSHVTQVVEVGHIQVLTGAEAIRGRLLQLYAKVKDSSILVSNNLRQQLQKKFQGESIPHDVSWLRETVAAIAELQQEVAFKEIIVTLEQDPNGTVTNMASIGDSSLFFSLHEDTIDKTTQWNSKKNCYIEPTSLLLTPPIKNFDTLLLRCMHSQAMQFETVVSPEGVLEVTPVMGLVQPGETRILKISCSGKNFEEGEMKCRVCVYVENDVMAVDVRVISIQDHSFKY